MTLSIKNVDAIESQIYSLFTNIKTLPFEDDETTLNELETALQKTEGFEEILRASHKEPLSAMEAETLESQLHKIDSLKAMISRIQQNCSQHKELSDEKRIAKWDVRIQHLRTEIQKNTKNRTLTSKINALQCKILALFKHHYLSPENHKKLNGLTPILESLKIELESLDTLKQECKTLLDVLNRNEIEAQTTYQRLSSFTKLKIAHTLVSLYDQNNNNWERLALFCFDIPPLGRFTKEQKVEALQMCLNDAPLSDLGAFTNVPIEVIILIAWYVGDPALFEKVCRTFKFASRGVYSQLNKICKQIEILEDGFLRAEKRIVNLEDQDRKTFKYAYQGFHKGVCEIGGGKNAFVHGERFLQNLRTQEKLNILSAPYFQKIAEWVHETKVENFIYFAIKILTYFEEEPSVEKFIDQIEDSRRKGDKKKILKYAARIINLIENSPNFQRALDTIDDFDLEQSGSTYLSGHIGALRNLEHLNLSNNHLRALPNKIQLLQNLTDLDIRSNSFQKIPESIFTLHNLQTLLMSSNNLRTLPESISSLSLLKVLNLEDTSLTALPKSIGLLTDLRILNLHLNRLENLPEDICSLSNLEALCLSRNQLKALPERFDSLSTLQVLSLNENALEVLPEKLGSLQNLVFLKVSQNRLTTLPGSVGSLNNLILFDLHDNPLTSLPDEIISSENPKICWNDTVLAFKKV